MQSSDRRSSTVVVAWRLIWIVGLGILLTWPAMWHGWPDLGHDSVNHARWLEEFSAQLKGGEWYPRWLTAANGGLGSPTFFYYPPLGHYLSTPLLGLWPPGNAAAWHSLGLSSGLVLIASGVIAYFWLARWAGASAALWGAIVYMLAPWHTVIDLYNRGAWSEFCGFLWMPLALLGVDRLIAARRGAVLLIAVSYALLVLTHLPTAMLLSPVLLAYAFFLGPHERRLALAFQTGCGMLLGMGIAAVYLLPAALQQDAASVKILGATGFYDYRKWFLGADIHSLLDYKMRVLVVTVSMLAAGVAAYWLSRSAYNYESNRTRMIFWLGVAAVCLFFMTPLSGFFWSTIRPLAAISFPNRFNTILTLAIAVLWAGAAPATRGIRSRWAVLLACAFGVVWLVWTGWAASRGFLAWRSDPKGVIRLQDDQRLRAEPYEYFTRWALSAQRHGIEAPLANLLGRGLRLESAGQGPAMPGSVSIVSWAPRRAVLKVETRQAAHLVVGQFYYLGWQAQDLTDQRQLPVSPSPTDGFLSVDIPDGTRQILLRLEPQTPERLGLAISAVSCLFACVLGIASVGWRRAHVIRRDKPPVT